MVELKELKKNNLLVSSFITISAFLKSLMLKLKNKLKFIEVKKIKINFKQNLIVYSKILKLSLRMIRFVLLTKKT
ncbi:hypothetical protein B0A69_13210 [Chryseobacterium shigense]|uniref:Uncharacterized protein n=1 Tax=Chryseobacterium shigense TaxID=297244 RepID=A0A1N7HTV3_9FLAO|nr:hypothetical protein B0A69_13210 [Chryseobacterium shigense]SIS28178.1 hypothetical protein SAMN05421639_10198 [Chryseobacterium shigense]